MKDYFQKRPDSSLYSTFLLSKKDGHFVPSLLMLIHVPEASQPEQQIAKFISIFPCHSGIFPRSISQRNI